MSEADLARAVVRQLEAWGFDVYQEVTLGGPRADIVGVRGALVCVVEAKMSLSFDVMAQAEDWKREAHEVWIAVPRLKIRSFNRGRFLAMKLCAQLGIGVFEVIGERAEVVHHAAINRFAKPQKLREALRPEHKTFAAAGTSGPHWTRWKGSVQLIIEQVERQPGLPLRELLRLVRHHWASDRSAASCLTRQITGGIIKDLRLVQEGKVMRVYKQEATP